MSKLISYYFKRDKWILLAMVACALLSSLLLWNVEDDTFMGAMTILLGVTAFLFSVVVAPLWLLIRDYKRMYGSYGSFFAALPLTGKEVIGGRFFWFLIVQFVVFIGTAIFIGPPAYRNAELYEGIRDSMNMLTTPIGGKYLTGFILLVIAGILFGISAWLFVTAVGSEKPFRRFGIGGPIMLYIGLQVAMNVVTQAVVNAMGSQRQIVNEEFFEQALSQQFFRTSLVLSGLMLIAAVVLFLRSVHSHDKKLSVS